ncbi:hypothetical protein R3P38DRAFT_3007595, partial [Favolaschia claudopus]
MVLTAAAFLYLRPRFVRSRQFDSQIETQTLSPFSVLPSTTPNSRNTPKTPWARGQGIVGSRRENERQPSAEETTTLPTLPSVVLTPGLQVDLEAQLQAARDDINMLVLRMNEMTQADSDFLVRESMGESEPPP